MRKQYDLAALVGDFRIVGTVRAMRVASETLPFSIGTLRSTRNSTRLFFTSA
jgi:hypothetical protein